MKDMMTLDLFQSQRLRDIGINSVYQNNSSWVDEARAVAKQLARKDGQVSIDEVLDFLPRPEDIHPNATGSVFRERCWKKVGYKSSSKPSAHARAIGIYQLLENV